MVDAFGALALAGIAPFSGFFSKGEILASTFEAGSESWVFLALYALGIATSFLTAFYAFRMWFMSFRGQYRGHAHPHESPRVMTVPLMILGAFTLVSGLSAYAMGGFGNLIFYPAGNARAQFPLVGVPLKDYALEAVALGVSLSGLLLAWVVYDARIIAAERFTSSRTGAILHRMLSHRYWIDDVYDAFAARVFWIFTKSLDWFDRNVVDGIVNAVGRGGVVGSGAVHVFDSRIVDGAVNALSHRIVRAGLRLRMRQTGQVQDYAWVIVLGIAVLIAFVFGVGGTSGTSTCRDGSSCSFRPLPELCPTPEKPSASGMPSSERPKEPRPR